MHKGEGIQIGPPSKIDRGPFDEMPDDGQDLGGVCGSAMIPRARIQVYGYRMAWGAATIPLAKTHTWGGI